ncbi:uncharacterized protein LOC120218600 isoform X2 [Hibiscus syriacus]|uniref:uncharacterized protein LOC120218600 isoform X1 n=1 Tax=Hibiscus syriacus TaxID=106335 RepID=UPI00192162A3|nr:uncharacterized protein LOC120218600 isoform X1 [Hibiscus syriacus]XP_039071466.1 uncharacterized protein LOC120218600 isoform X2 [Hibiscus syriacus]
MAVKIQISSMNHFNETPHTKHKNMKSSSSLVECCMCGDPGITRELFRCKICHFRAQHRYCSNLYPKSKSYKVCNWCLNQKDDSKEMSQNSLNSSSSCKSKIELKQQQKLIKNPMKKPNSEEKSCPRKKRKRIISNDCLPDTMRGTKSEEKSKNGVITRHVFRNKVRRYKLLEEVSS